MNGSKGAPGSAHGHNGPHSVPFCPPSTLCPMCLFSGNKPGEVWLERGKEAFLWLPKIPVTEKGGSRQPLPLLDAFSMFGIQSLGRYKISSSK